MSEKKLRGAAPAVLASCLCIVSIAAARAEPLSYIQAAGIATAHASTGAPYSDTYASQIQTYGSQSPGIYVPSGYSGTADVAARGTVVFNGPYPPYPLYFPTAADATTSGTATFGALHASAVGDTSIGDLLPYTTTSNAGTTLKWLDTLTFRTSNPLGADYHFSLTLSDALSTSLGAPGQSGYAVVPNGGDVITSIAETYLAVIPQTAEFAQELVITDLFKQFGSSDGMTPGPTSQSLAPSHTMAGTIHVSDGEVVIFEQVLSVGIDLYNVNGSASALAGDTAYFNLSTLDADASYIADSGTLFATRGDPDAPPVTGGPPTTVPEPAIAALMAIGFATLALVARQPARSASWRRPPDPLLSFA